MKNKKNTAGFTFIEISIVAVLAITILAAVVGFQYAFGQNQLIIWKNYLSISNANTNLRDMVREIRSAQISALGAYPLEILSDNEIVFFTDIDFDEVIERVRYTRSENVLTKGITKPSGQPLGYSQDSEIVTTISEIIRNDDLPIFYYYNGEWPTDTVNNPLSVENRISKTRVVQILLNVNQNENDTFHNTILQSLAQIRILKDNL